MKKKLFMIYFTVVLITAYSYGLGESLAADAKPQGGDDLQNKVQNPVGSLISLPLKLSVDLGAPNGSAYIFNVNPVVPVTVGNWNLINRALIPALVSVDGLIGGTPGIPYGSTGNRKTGIGDINYSLFVSPANPDKVIWGIGPSINIPTATDRQLGSGKWSAGPTGVMLVQPEPWTLGVLARQLWSFAGPSGRRKVNQFLVEPFVNYNLAGGWYLISDMIITANWDAWSGERWTVPLGGGVGKLFKHGVYVSVPVPEERVNTTYQA